MQSDSGLYGIPNREDPPRSEIWFQDAAGYGSTGTKIMVFSSVLRSLGTCFTYVNDPILGDSVRVNRTCVVSVSFSQDPTSASAMGISVNSTQLTTSIANTLVANTFLGSATSAGANQSMSFSITFIAYRNDIIRAHTDGVAPATYVRFRVTQVSL